MPIPLSENAIYVTINDILEKDKYRPYELFINTKNLQHLSWIVAMTRLISAVFRHQSNSSFLVEELKSIYDPNGGYFKNGSYVPSLAADIGIVIEEHLKRLGIIKNKKKNIIVENSIEQKMTICPKCGEKALINQEKEKLKLTAKIDKESAAHRREYPKVDNPCHPCQHGCQDADIFIVTHIKKLSHS